jgi:hypothetical protein
LGAIFFQQPTNLAVALVIPVLLCCVAGWLLLVELLKQMHYKFQSKVNLLGNGNLYFAGWRRKIAQKPQVGLSASMV